MDVVGVKLAGEELKLDFECQLLRVSPPVLDVGHTVEDMNLQLNYRVLQPQRSTPCAQLPLRTRALKEAVPLLFSDNKPEFLYVTQTSAGDSGYEGPLDTEITSPFTDVETVRVNDTLVNCWEVLGQAQSFKFHNAQGKFFLQTFFTLAKLALPDYYSLGVFHSTNPSGDS